MCGIVGATARRSVSEILLRGLERLEYRGYDSAGMALLDEARALRCHKTVGKVSRLAELCRHEPLDGATGIAHTRWATHGNPSTVNAHPHLSQSEIAIVHNGIIENHDEIRRRLVAAGYEMASETDSELIAHLIHHELQSNEDLSRAVAASAAMLAGAYALAAISSSHPGHIVATRSGSPLVLGIGIGENFIASDQLALRQVTDRFIFLEEGDLVEMSATGYRIWQRDGREVQREISEISGREEYVSRGNYHHFMAKEIHEQPDAIRQTLQARVGESEVLPALLEGVDVDRIQAIDIVACGTSYHAGLIAKYWFEELTDLPCHVEIASEYRYRKVNRLPDTIFISISQSGETADTLAALRKAKSMEYLSTLCICNVPNSSLHRESDHAIFTAAGLEIGVAATKAFTTQLTALMLLVIAIGRRHSLSREREAELIQALRTLPNLVELVLRMDREIRSLAEDFVQKHHALFLGRGTHYPVAMEGALKLKEISYIHAEAYPAGELKHGPLALVDEDMPVVTVAPNDNLLDKLESNLQEVKARGGKLYVFADDRALSTGHDDARILYMPHVHDMMAPIVYTVPLQMLAYHVAVLRGTDVDRPRNLAKSVTVE